VFLQAKKRRVFRLSLSPAKISKYNPRNRMLKNRFYVDKCCVIEVFITL
jgi:hypothetical protein